MKELNTVVVSGRVVKEAKIIRTKDEKASVVVVDLAVNKFSSTAPDHKKVEYYHVLAFGSVADRLTKVEKGTAVIIEGNLSSTVQKKDEVVYRNTTIVASDFCYVHFPSNTTDLMISGRASKDLWVSPKGNFTSFDLANSYYSFEVKDFKTQFIPVVAYGEELVAKMQKAIKKGYRLYIKGHLVSIIKESEGGKTTNQMISVDAFHVLDMGKATPKKEETPSPVPVKETEPNPFMEEIDVPY